MAPMQFDPAGTGKLKMPGLKQGSLVATLASGAAGLWWFDQIDTATQTVPNAMTATPIDGNLLRAPRRLFSNNNFWGPTNLTVSNDGTTALSLTGVNGDATTFTPTAAGWYLRPGAGSGGNLPAGNYTLEMCGSVASGTKALFFNIAGNTAKTFTLGTLTTTPGRIFCNFSAAAAFSPNNLIIVGDGTDVAAFVGVDIKLKAGTLSPSATAADAPAGHLQLGTCSTDSRIAGKYANGELDMSTNQAAGLIQFPATLGNGTPFTVQAVMRKSLAGSGFQGFLSKVGAYSEFTAWSEQSGVPNLANGGATNVPSTLWPRLKYGKHVVLTHRFDGAKYSFWLDDIQIAVSTGSANTGFRDLWFNGINFGFTSGDIYAGGVVAYTSSLTDQQVVTNVGVLRARAQTAGVAANMVGPVTNFMVIESDSRGGAGQWPAYLNITSPLFGVCRGVSGSTLDSGSNQVVSRIAAAPAFPTRSGLKIYGFLSMLGANDLGTYAGATDSAAVSAYYASEKANVFDAWAAKGVNRFGMLTELPFPANGTNPHNTRKDLLNAMLRNAFPGSNGGTVIDLENATTGDTRWADNNGGNNYPTLYTASDNGHPSTAGYQLIASIATTGINAMLAAG